MKPSAFIIVLACMMIGTGSWAQTVREQPCPNTNMACAVCVDDDCHTAEGIGSEPMTYFAAQSYAMLLKLNSNMSALINQQSALLGQLNTTSTATNTLVAQQINTFNENLRNSISARFDQLPQDLAASDMIKQLKADILKQVDDKLKTLQPPAPAGH